MLSSQNRILYCVFILKVYEYYEVCLVLDVLNADSCSSCSPSPQLQTDIDLFCLLLSCAIDPLRLVP